MNFNEFSRKFKYSPYFKGSSISTVEGNIRTLRNQLVQWQRQGKVYRLGRGLYTLADDFRQAPLPPFLVSNLLYPPSYISLETTLSYCGLIPERTGAVTAVTTRKTMEFQNPLGLFRYRRLNPSYFFGYELVKLQEGITVLMAFPEKSLLDLVYYDRRFIAEEDYFLENLRLQNYENLSLQRLGRFAKRFRSAKLLLAAEIVERLIREERK